MSRLINTTTMTVDAVTDVAEWFISEGEHDEAAHEQFLGTAGMLMGRKTYEGLAAYWPEQSGPWGGPAQPDAEVRRLADARRLARLERDGDRGGRGAGRLAAQGRARR
jgi:dihydrofolate reductase